CPLSVGINTSSDTPLTFTLIFLFSHFIAQALNHDDAPKMRDSLAVNRVISHTMSLPQRQFY
ncbi:MAG: hypothetical protein ACRCUH_02270, partial [Shewanella sp.]